MPRYGIKTNLNRMFSSISAARNQREREALIAAQQGKRTKAGPFYSIDNFEFNEKTRTARISFKQVEKYRKIERYITVNYVRNPIYSDYWLTKEKTIKKTIKLSNKELEELPSNQDSLIQNFRFEIVEKLNNEDLVPSWAIIHSLNKDRESLLEDEKKKLLSAIKELENINNGHNNKKKQLISINSIETSLLKKERNKYNLLKKKYYRQRNVFLSIVTFGIYSYLLSKKHKSKLSCFIKKSEDKMTKHEKTIADNNRQLSLLDEWINENNKKANDARKTYNENCTAIENKIDNLISEVRPLESDISDRDDFIPLKKMAGVEYQKIKGCYVIHNKEKDKFYVGQSKDVLKRILRDHFSGTEVKNIIFAQDYYTSQYEDKADLFEVKIIRCETKDELDKTEKELIEYYDSFRNGYNGTGGNS